LYELRQGQVFGEREFDFMLKLRSRHFRVCHGLVNLHQLPFGPVRELRRCGLRLLKLLGWHLLRFQVHELRFVLGG